MDDLASLFGAKPKPEYLKSNVDLATPADRARARSLPPAPSLWESIADAPRYYLGPTGIPERLGHASQIAAMMSPGADMMDAASASGDLMRARSPMEAATAGAAMVGALGSMFIPGSVNRMAEGLTKFGADESGALRLLHGSPRGDLTPDSVQMFRAGTRQGNNYGGFYTTPEGNDAYAMSYAGPNGYLYDVELPDAARVMDLPAGEDITRLSRQFIDDSVQGGYAAVRGKDFRGKPEVVVIDPRQITSMKPRPK